MTFTRFLLPLLFLASPFFLINAAGQYVDIPSSYATSMERLARYIQSSCPAPEDRLLSIQKWMSENLIYDASTSSSQTTPEENAKQIFRTHKGVCAHFAALFCVLANKAGVEVFLVEGAALNQNGLGSHAWCATVINGQPYLLDPTWASGGLNLSSGKMVQRLDLKNFLQAPDKYQFNHIPLDPLWQFSEHPLTYEQAEKKIAANDKDNPYFNWQDTLALYQSQDSIAREESACRRAMANGKPNTIIANQLQAKKISLKNRVENQTSDIHNRAHEKAKVINADLVQIADRINNTGKQTSLSRSKDLERLKKIELEIDECEAQLRTLHFADKANQEILNNTRKSFAFYRAKAKGCKDAIEQQININNFRSIQEKYQNITKESNRLHTLIEKTDKEMLKTETKVTSSLNQLDKDVSECLNDLTTIKTNEFLTPKQIEELRTALEEQKSRIDQVRKELTEKKGK